MNYLLTPTEVAEYLRINYYKVMDLIAVGDLPAFKVGRQYRIKFSDLNKYLEDRKMKVPA